MIHRQGAEIRSQVCYCVQRNQVSAARMNVEHGESRGVRLIFVLELHHHPIFVVGGIYGRNLALAVSGVKSVFHLLGRNAKRGGFFAIDVDVHLRIRDEQIRGYVHKTGKLGHFLHERGGITIKLRRVGTLKRELILALGNLTADLDRRQVLHVSVNSSHRGKLLAKFLDYFIDVRMVREQRRDSANCAPHHGHAAIFLVEMQYGGTFRRGTIFALLQVNEDDPPIAGGKTSYARKEIVTVGIVEHNLIQFELMLPHGIERNSLRCFRRDEYLGSVFRGKKPFWNNRELPDRDDQNDSGHGHYEHFVAHGPLQRNVVNVQKRRG